MRADMSKKLVERPRWGRQAPNGTVTRERQAVDLDALPRRSRMRPNHGSRAHPSENFAPLLRFLRTRCGTHWDAVYSELRQSLDLRSATQIHIFEHLYDFVALHALIEDGVIYDVGRTWRGRQKLRRDGRSFFVHPKSGLLREVPAARSIAPAATPHRVERNGQIYVRHRGVWYRVELKTQSQWYRPTDRDRAAGRDVLLKAKVGPQNEAVRASLYGRATRYAIAKYPLNRKALKALGLWRA